MQVFTRLCHMYNYYRGYTLSGRSVTSSYDSLTLARLEMGDCFSVTTEIKWTINTNHSKMTLAKTNCGVKIFKWSMPGMLHMKKEFFYF